MNWRWESGDGWLTCTGSRDSGREPRFGGCSEIPERGSFGWSGGGKNSVRRLWAAVAEDLRPQAAPGSGSLLWGCPHLRGGGDPPRPLWELRQGEAGAACLAGRQPVLHQTLRVLRGAALPHLDDSRCRSRSASGLDNAQGPGAVASSSATWSPYDHPSLWRRGSIIGSSHELQWVNTIAGCDATLPLGGGTLRRPARPRRRLAGRLGPWGIP